MKLLAVFLVISFVGVAVFGFLGMVHADTNDHRGCIAAEMQRTNCPEGGNALDSVTFHLGALKDFSNAIFEVNIFATLLTLALLVAMVGLRMTRGNLASPQLRLAYSRHGQRKSFRPFLERKLTRWLALHEDSPALF
ncbi:MAG: hypothetical protein A3D65_03475 [Candidatus Lloydbacteria bacterium RIFCSPHIGHO2_02_FULL_50_13]|uniref:Uncharacterized protein n=1 Tax=Candidatus Lloydbacteria bacterium RIFCSPHIGHO2_02_FULL_50_13 TaxID=1798661 RepID=A0A1G2D6K7_9BACT|nr:MAG: hypothetical protein A3D65_03475 [Candidatus Lloydbacteria bacterium RIFCSPHIGHO2_02_FULL_50_13]